VNIAGHCGKCGAPYFWLYETWLGTCPPPVSPSCECWITVTTVSASSIRISPQNAPCRNWKCAKFEHPHMPLSYCRTGEKGCPECINCGYPASAHPTQDVTATCTDYDIAMSALDYWATCYEGKHTNATDDAKQVRTAIARSLREAIAHAKRSVEARRG